MAGKKDTLKLVSNEQLIADIAAGVQLTFSEMFSLHAKVGKHHREVGTNLHADISGIVNLIQEKEEGSFIVSFPATTIFAMLAKIYHKPFSTIDHSVENGVGELTNIIYGTIKTKLNKEGMDLKMAIPHVVIGRDHKVISIGHEPAFVIPFTTESGSFHVLLTMYTGEIKSSAA